MPCANDVASAPGSVRLVPRTTPSIKARPRAIPAAAAITMTATQASGTARLTTSGRGRQERRSVRSTTPSIDPNATNSATTTTLE
jgi:hypothetical protein